MKKHHSAAWLILAITGFSGIVGILGCNESTPESSTQAVQQAPIPGPSLRYLTADSISLATALVAPPSEDSATNRSELEEVLAFQKSRTPMECSRAQSEVTSKLKNFFGPPYGSLSDDQVEALEPLMSRVLLDAKYFVTLEKNHWRRPRPYSESALIHPCVDATETNDSYPSGHATYSRLFADILSVIDPAHQQDYQNRAHQIREDRVIAGMHHRSDIEAGVLLGDELFNVMKTNDAFQEDLSDAMSRFSNAK